MSHNLLDSVEEGRVLANKLGIYLSTHFLNLLFSSQTDFSCAFYPGIRDKFLPDSRSRILDYQLFIFGELSNNFVGVKISRNTAYSYHRLDHICFDVFDYLIMPDCMCCFLSFMSYDLRNKKSELNLEIVFGTFST
jgi:hypothetical protein